MPLALQTSLFDLAGDEPALTGTESLERRFLSHGAWVDHLQGWIQGSDALFERVVASVRWRAEERRMYDAVVAVPRLVAMYGPGDPLPDPLLTEARDRLSAHYADELGEPFLTAGLCLYRDGRDSVAWHGDRIGRGRTQDTMIAIVSLGEERRLLLRPNGGGGARSQAFALGHGDLLVMGGSCQRTWEHSVPKTAKPVGPRISIQFRPRAVY